MPPRKKTSTKKSKRQTRTMAPMDLDRREQSNSLGYLIAKMESLDRYIRDHMDKEEATTKDLYSRIEQTQKTVQQLKLWQWIIIILMIMMSMGAPVGEILIKLLGAL